MTTVAYSNKEDIMETKRDVIEELLKESIRTGGM